MFLDIYRAAVEEIAAQYPEGFTVELTTMQLVTTGIAVGHKETQNCFNLDEALRHATYNYGIVGGWRNPEGRMQYDSIRLFTDLPKAIKWGRKQKQYAIFDIDNGWEIIL